MVGGGTELEYVGRIAGAAILGGIIGFEREIHGQSAGLRTHMIVAIGAALMMIVSILIGEHYGQDPGRIAAQVVTGIGFLGAGAIVRLGMGVRGLTTAAAIWTAAGIGLAIGAGWYVGAVAATVITFLTISVFHVIERAVLGGKHVRRMIVRIRDHAGAVGEIEERLGRHGCHIKEVGIGKDVLQKKATLTITASCPDKCDFDALSQDMSTLPEVESVEIG